MEGPGDYALLNGLTVDYLTNPPVLNPTDDAHLAATIDEDTFNEEVYSFLLPKVYFRWIIPRTEYVSGHDEAVARHLKSISPLTDQVIEKLVSQTYTSVDAKQLRIEPPILRSNCRLDCRDLSRKVEKMRKGPLPRHTIPLEPVNIENDGGLQFPRSAKELDTRIMNGLEEEKTMVDKTDMEILAKTLDNSWTPDDQQSLWESIEEYRGLKATRKMTPPLTTLLEPYEPFVPDARTFDVPIPSDPSSRLSEEIKDAEEKIFQEDNILSTDTIQDTSSPDFLPVLDPPEMIQTGGMSSPTPRPLELKIEVPLLTLDSDVMIMSPGRHLATACELVGDFDEGKAEALDEEMNKYFKKVEDKTLLRAEQEKLQSVDTTARIPIPVMDFKTPDPEWQMHRTNPKAMMRWILKTSGTMTRLPKWPRDQAMEQNMVWMPIPANAGNLSKLEVIDADQQVLDAFLSVPNEDEVQTSASFVRKQEGLAVLRPRFDDDDDFLSSPLSVPGTKSDDGVLSDLEALVKQRKRILEEQDKDDDSDRKRIKTPFSRRPATATTQFRSPKDSQSTLIRSSASKTEDLLASFLEMRGKRFSEPTKSAFFPTPETSSDKSGPLQLTNAPDKDTPGDVAMMPPPPKPLPPPPVPNVVASGTIPTVIGSIALSRNIWSSLSELLPDIQIIERNYDAYNSSVWRPGSVKLNEVRSVLADEADIIISPATGLLFRPLIRLRQKAGPGSSGKPLFWTQIERISARFEHLIVLVSEGSSHETTKPLVPSDAKALAEFQGFVAGLSTDVSVYYVGGGEATLAKWAAAMIAKYAAEGTEVQDLLVQPETWWELLLRRVGLNVYAAQAILSLLRAPYREDEARQDMDESPGIHGLPQFIQMTLEERIEAFEGVMGGRRVLERVSKIIDSIWAQPRRANRPDQQRALRAQNEDP